MLRPLRDRVLIKPLGNPEQTESGLHLVEHRKPETHGEVIVVGSSVHPLKDVAEDLAQRLQKLIGQVSPTYGGRFAGVCFSDTQEELFRDAAGLLCDLARREPQVKPGDVVIFSWTAGQEVFVNDERYLLLHESDITAVYEPEGELIRA